MNVRFCVCMVKDSVILNGKEGKLTKKLGGKCRKQRLKGKTTVALSNMGTPKGLNEIVQQMALL